MDPSKMNDHSTDEEMALSILAGCCENTIQNVQSNLTNTDSGGMYQQSLSANHGATYETEYKSAVSHRMVANPNSANELSYYNDKNEVAKVYSAHGLPSGATLDNSNMSRSSNANTFYNLNRNVRGIAQERGYFTSQAKSGNQNTNYYGNDAMTPLPNASCNYYTSNAGSIPSASGFYNSPNDIPSDITADTSDLFGSDHGGSNVAANNSGYFTQNANVAGMGGVNFYNSASNTSGISNDSQFSTNNNNNNRNISNNSSNFYHSVENESARNNAGYYCANVGPATTGSSSVNYYDMTTTQTNTADFFNDEDNNLNSNSRNFYSAEFKKFYNEKTSQAVTVSSSTTGYFTSASNSSGDSSTVSYYTTVPDGATAGERANYYNPSNSISGKSGTDFFDPSAGTLNAPTVVDHSTNSNITGYYGSSDNTIGTSNVRYYTSHHDNHVSNVNNGVGNYYTHDRNRATTNSSAGYFTSESINTATAIPSSYNTASVSNPTGYYTPAGKVSSSPSSYNSNSTNSSKGYYTTNVNNEIIASPNSYSTSTNENKGYYTAEGIRKMEMAIASKSYNTASSNDGKIYYTADINKIVASPNSYNTSSNDSKGYYTTDMNNKILASPSSYNTTATNSTKRYYSSDIDNDVSSAAGSYNTASTNNATGYYTSDVNNEVASASNSYNATSTIPTKGYYSTKVNNKVGESSGSYNTGHLNDSAGYYTADMNNVASPCSYNTASTNDPPGYYTTDNKVAVSCNSYNTDSTNDSKKYYTTNVNNEVSISSGSYNTSSTNDNAGYLTSNINNDVTSTPNDQGSYLKLSCDDTNSSVSNLNKISAEDGKNEITVGNASCFFDDGIDVATSVANTMRALSDKIDTSDNISDFQNISPSNDMTSTSDMSDVSKLSESISQAMSNVEDYDIDTTGCSQDITMDIVMSKIEKLYNFNFKTDQGGSSITADSTIVTACDETIASANLHGDTTTFTDNTYGDAVATAYGDTPASTGATAYGDTIVSKTVTVYEDAIASTSAAAYGYMTASSNANDYDDAIASTSAAAYGDAIASTSAAAYGNMNASTSASAYGDAIDSTSVAAYLNMTASTSASAYGDAIASTSAAAYGDALASTSAAAYGDAIASTSASAYGDAIASTSAAAYGYMTASTSASAYGDKTTINEDDRYDVVLDVGDITTVGNSANEDVKPESPPTNESVQTKSEPLTFDRPSSENILEVIAALHAGRYKPSANTSQSKSKKDGFISPPPPRKRGRKPKSGVSATGEYIEFLTCIRKGCNKRSVPDEEWDHEFCSSSCAVLHVNESFDRFLKNRMANKKQKA